MYRLIVFSLFLFTNALYAQNCKYKVNEIDKFTGQYTKLTKSEKVISTFYTVGDFSVQKVDTSFYFIFDYVLSSYSNFDAFNISPSQKLIFLLENGEVINLFSADNILGTKKTVIGLPPVYECFLTKVSYPISKSDIDKLFKSKVKSIRFYRNEANGKEVYIDNDIKKKNQDDIQDLIKCVL
jgi:hypothetical protein